MRTVLPALFILLVASFAVAGAPDNPEVSDASGDLSREEGTLVGVTTTAQEFSDVDLLAAWVEEDTDGTLRVTVQTAGDVTDSTEMEMSFKIEATADSVFGSTANGTTHTFGSTGATLHTGPEAANVTQAGNLTTFHFNLTQVGAAGGDQLVNLTVTASNSDDGGTASPFTADDQSATDTMPDEGSSRAYKFAREAPFGSVTLDVASGSLTETVEGETTTRDVGDEATTKDPNASAAYTVTVTNLGTDQDTVTLMTTSDATATVEPTEFSLIPGESRTVNVTITLSESSGTVVTVLEAETVRGAMRTQEFRITVESDEPEPAPEPSEEPTPGGEEEPSERNPVLAVGFLTTMAEGMGLDSVFGDFAEVALLAIFLLLIVLIVFLVLFLAGRQWVTLKVTPKTVAAAPGETAEFQVEVHNAKKYAMQARMYYEPEDTTWKTGILMSQDEGATLDPLTEADHELEFTMNGKGDPGDHYTGTVRVRIPDAESDKERRNLRLVVVPLDEDGNEKRNRTRLAKLTIRSDVNAAKPKPEYVPPVRLTEVTHDPVHPEVGDTVTTEARLENDDDTRTHVLRVVLNIDDEDVQEQICAVPARKGRAVVFTWDCEHEESRVRVLVFEKEPVQ